MMFRTDRNNNPTAFTTDIAHDAGLVLGTDYEQGESFNVGGHTYYTAKLLGNPLLTTIKVIDKLGFYTTLAAHPRWEYIAIPRFVWDGLDMATKTQVIQFMYHREGGTELESIFGE